MDNGQNRASARGPLIAVIKIEIDSTRTDRIFLHQHDNDQLLAQQFVQKHGLKTVLTQHIYERIRQSREALQIDAGLEKQQQRRSTKRMEYSNSNYKLQTPVNNLVSRRETQKEQLSQLDQVEQQSFEERGRERNRKGHHQRYSYLQQPLNRNQRLFTATKHKEEHNWAEACLQAPSKQQIIKEKEFMFYDNQGEESQNDVALFAQQKTPIADTKSSNKKENKLNFFSKQVQKPKFRQQRMNSEPKATKILQFLETQDKQQTLRNTKSVAKIKPAPPVQEQAKNVNKTEFSRVSQTSDYTKPTHVKIMRKEEIQSLNQSLKKSMSKQQISRINQEVTKRLYNQVSIKKNYLNIIREKAKKEKQKMEDVELTHRPIINQISQIIAQGRKKEGVPVELYLIDKGKKVQAKRHEELGRKALEELNGCTFKPELNVITQKLAQDREELESRIKMRESNRKSRYQDQNRFKPQLNTITRQLMKDRGCFQERQRDYLQQKNERLVNLVREKLLKQTKDEQTGQQLFKPKINESTVRESQGPNIGNYLHVLSKQPKEVSQPISMVPRISEASEIIVREMQTRRLTWLFGELDGDQDGLISAQKINIDTISPQILAIIKPILFQMEEINQELTLEEFINAMKVLHKRLTAFEKDKLYNVKKQLKIKQIVD